MYIKSIDIRNSYSFGEEGTPELQDLQPVNLFIGKNGAGKTNIVRTLLKIPIGDIPLADIKNGNEVIPTADDKRIFKSIQGKQNHFIYQHQSLCIELDEGTISTEPIQEITPFSQNRSGRTSKFTEGSFELLTRLRESSLHISSAIDKGGVQMKLSEGGEFLLQFAFFYIFGKSISKKGNEITEYKNSNDLGGLGGDSMNYESTADGYISIFNIVSQLVSNNKSLIFLEEPENNLEPRAIKKLLQFLIYFLFGKESLPTEIVIEIEQDFEQYKKSKIHYSKYSTPEPFLDEHEKTVKSNAKKVSQLFLISHSPIVIDTLRQLPIKSSIYEIFEDKGENKSSVNTEAIAIDHNETIYTEFSKVRKVSDIWDTFILLNNIGIKNSDLLQANGLIWVEGPTDAMYIKKFLEMYTSENHYRKFLAQGRDYEFAIYGGALLDSYFLYEKVNDNEHLKKLVSFVSQNKNFYVIMDSDAILKEEKIIDQSNFEKAKDYIARSIDEISSKYNYAGYWYAKGTTKYRTIEDYITLDKKVLDEEDVKNFGIRNKRTNALKVVNYLDKSKIPLGDINLDLENEIKKLYEKIIKWNS